MDGPIELPSVQLKTKMITFDDRLQQVRVLAKKRNGQLSHGMMSIRFLNYNDDDGFYYVKKYRKDWASIIEV